MTDMSGNTPPCWEFMNCPDEVCSACPAYPEYGFECWKLTGTKCNSGAFFKTSFEEKILHCRNECEFYKTHLKKLYP